MGPILEGLILSITNFNEGICALVYIVHVCVVHHVWVGEVVSIHMYLHAIAVASGPASPVLAGPV